MLTFGAASSRPARISYCLAPSAAPRTPTAEQAAAVGRLRCALADPLPTLLVASLAAFALALLSAVAGFGLPGARTQYERALQISEAALGPDHRQTRQVRRNLDDVV